MTKPNTEVKGHGLMYEGAPHDENGDRAGYRGVSGVGRAFCKCRAKSPILPSANQRQQWHREHKAAIRNAASD